MDRAVHITYIPNMKMNKALIAIPAFNEEDSIAAVLRTLPRDLPGVDALRYLVVDDGSSDHTAQIAEAEGAVVLRHGVNRGVGKAFQTAVDYALRIGADIMVTIDADGQFSAGEIEALIRPITEEKADLVTGCRFGGSVRPSTMPLIKYWGNLGIARMLHVFGGLNLADVSCGFRAYSREALLNLNLFGAFTYTQETLLDLSFKGLRIVELPVHVQYFKGRQSRVAGSVLRYAVNASKIILRTIRDFKPLRFFGAVGLMVFLLGSMFDLWLLRYWMLTGSLSPFKVVGFIGAALNIGGFLLAGLGLVADMLDRIRLNQERLLYYQKRNLHGDGSWNA